jgi:hypothetical protein
MELPVDQKIVCEIDKSIIDNILKNIKEEDWFVDDYRNRASCMQDTNSILIFHSVRCGDSPNALLTVEKRPLFARFYPLILPVLDKLKNYCDYNYHASFITRLNPRGTINKHADRGYFLEKCHRIHVPLKTNKGVTYWIDGKQYYWEVGNVYEFNNLLEHEVINNSDQERIHLILNLYNLSEDELSILNKPD